MQLQQALSSNPDAEITIPQVLAPECVDLTHGSYTIMDGIYHAYLMVPSAGYNSHVVAGWTSILVNAGEGIDIDFFIRIMVNYCLLKKNSSNKINKRAQLSVQKRGENEKIISSIVNWRNGSFSRCMWWKRQV